MHGVSDTFAAIFTDLDQVAMLSRLGYTGVVRQGLFGGGGYSVISATSEGFSPNPSYWAYLAYKRFMGVKVLDVGALGGSLRSYAHCHPTIKGAVSVMVLNVSPNPCNLTVSLTSVMSPRELGSSWVEYHLTMPLAGGQNLTTKDIAINGRLGVKKNSSSTCQFPWIGVIYNPGITGGYEPQQSLFGSLQAIKEGDESKRRWHGAPTCSAAREEFWSSQFGGVLGRLPRAVDCAVSFLLLSVVLPYFDAPEAFQERAPECFCRPTLMFLVASGRSS